MTDSVQAQLEAVLRGIEERTKHSDECGATFLRWRCRSCGEKSPYQSGCDCDWQDRVRAEQARAVERMIEAAIRATSDDVSLPDVWAAALRAGEAQ